MSAMSSTRCDSSSRRTLRAYRGEEGGDTAKGHGSTGATRLRVTGPQGRHAPPPAWQLPTPPHMKNTPISSVCPHPPHRGNHLEHGAEAAVLHDDSQHGLRLAHRVLLHRTHAFLRGGRGTGLSDPHLPPSLIPPHSPALPLNPHSPADHTPGPPLSCSTPGPHSPADHTPEPPLSC